MQSPPEQDHSRFQNVDPRVRDEVGGILERAFRREEGKTPDELEVSNLRALAGEAEQKAEKADRLAEEALEAARHASEQYAISHALEDLEAVQHWEAEAASYQREAEGLRLEAEDLRKHLPG